MAGEEGLQQGRIMLRVTTGREHSSEQGQDAIQVLIDLLYLLLLSNSLFGFVSFSSVSLQSKLPVNLPQKGAAHPGKAGMHRRDVPRENQKPPQ